MILFVMTFINSDSLKEAMTWSMIIRKNIFTFIQKQKYMLHNMFSKGTVFLSNLR